MITLTARNQCIPKRFQLGLTTLNMATLKIKCAKKKKKKMPVSSIFSLCPLTMFYNPFTGKSKNLSQLLNVSSAFNMNKPKFSLSDKHFCNPTLYNNLTLSKTTNFGLFQTETVCRRQFQIR